ncbi:MAG: TetR/AcrR family transcriptional regulator [Clostridium sp.]|nr:TetR/AcrR family transcriptional regulator [Clostridium sp.]
MEKAKKEDLRVVKTLESIRRAFRDMICEMDYEDITIKELTERAMINRKTFYLHYNSLDDLLQELQDEIVDSFISQNVSYHSLDDIKRIIRYFYEYACSMPLLHERLLCSGSYQHVGEKINKTIMEYQISKYRGAFSSNLLIDDLVLAFFASNTTILYRQWVADGKQLPVEELIQTATTLICDGMTPFISA